jgi:putative glutamine amidotransferase
MTSAGAPPLIGITGRSRFAGEVDGLPSAWHDVPVEVYFTDYSAKVVAAGGLPVLLTRVSDVDALADRLAGLLLTGGSDVDPAHYRADPDPELGPVEPERDEFELRLLAAMAARGRPVFGICRGLQVANIWAGGTLHQHVPDHLRLDRGPAELVHGVAVDRTTTFGRRYPDEISVNTYHHQTIKVLGEGLRVVGRSVEDGEVEMLEHEEHRIAAVQWHPELLDGLDPGFTWLVEQSLPG